MLKFVKWSIFQTEQMQMQDICRESVGPLERTQGSATSPNSRWICKYVFSFFSQSFFIFYEFMMMPMIIFGRYYSNSSFSLYPSKSANFHALTVSLLPKNHMLFIVSKQCACSRRVHIEGHIKICFFLLFSIVFHILWIYDDAYDHFR
jgi:hypothetical protein